MLSGLMSRWIRSTSWAAASPKGGLRNHLGRLTRSEPALRTDSQGKTRSGNVLHGKIKNEVGRVGGRVDPDEIIVFDPGGGADLAGKALPHPFVVHVVAKHLQCDNATERSVSCAVNDPHPPAADLGFNVVRTERAEIARPLRRVKEREGPRGSGRLHAMLHRPACGRARVAHPHSQPLVELGVVGKSIEDVETGRARFKVKANRGR